MTNAPTSPWLTILFAVLLQILAAGTAVAQIDLSGVEATGSDKLKVSVKNGPNIRLEEEASFEIDDSNLAIVKGSIVVEGAIDDSQKKPIFTISNWAEIEDQLAILIAEEDPTFDPALVEIDQEKAKVKMAAKLKGDLHLLLQLSFGFTVNGENNGKLTLKIRATEPRPPACHGYRFEGFESFKASIKGLLSVSHKGEATTLELDGEATPFDRMLGFTYANASASAPIHLAGSIDYSGKRPVIVLDERSIADLEETLEAITFDETGTVVAVTYDGAKSSFKCGKYGSSAQLTYSAYVNVDDGARVSRGQVTIKSKMVLSGDASLSSLSLTGLTGVAFDQPFDPSIENYQATVPGTTALVEISAVSTDINATYSVNGGTSRFVFLYVGMNTISIVTTAAYGDSTTTYTLLITREPPVLASIGISSNTHLTIANGASAAEISVTFVNSVGAEMDGDDISYQLTANGVPQPPGPFTTLLADDYELQAISGSVESNVVTVVAREDKPYPIVTLPVVFHIVHFGESVGVGLNLAASEIDQVLDELNAAFSNQLGSTDPNAVDTGVRFRFAATSPAGTPMTEPGIDRFDGSVYDNGSRFNTATDFPADKILGPNEYWEMAGQTFWDPRDYMNVWIFDGYREQSSAGLPDVLASNPLPGLRAIPADGEPWKENFGSFALDVAARLRAVSHEMGHRLGLLHPFVYGMCSEGDYAPDTYTFRLDLSGFPACPGNLGVTISNNIMTSGLNDTFTYDQRERIRFVLDNAIWIRDLQFSTK